VRYLLDTHAFIWWIDNDARLSARAQAVVRDPDNEILVSAGTAWEIAIKAGLGQLEIPRDLPEIMPGQISANGFAVLPISLVHALYVARLPLLHRDPFDRILVAQAAVENLTLVTADPVLSRYDIPVIW
jgi:PIN domain nuclease of toxin-antitoxin system